MQIDTMPLSSIMDFLTIGGTITILIGAYQFYLYIKRNTKKEADFSNLVEHNKNEIRTTNKRITKMELDNEVNLKEIWVRMNKDKDDILVKVDEIDKKSENRFNKLTELIIDLFKSK